MSVVRLGEYWQWMMHFGVPWNPEAETDEYMRVYGPNPPWWVGTHGVTDWRSIKVVPDEFRLISPDDLYAPNSLYLLGPDTVASRDTKFRFWEVGNEWLRAILLRKVSCTVVGDKVVCTVSSEAGFGTEYQVSIPAEVALGLFLARKEPKPARLAPSRSPAHISNGAFPAWRPGVHSDSDNLLWIRFGGWSDGSYVDE